MDKITMEKINALTPEQKKYLLEQTRLAQAFVNACKEIDARRSL